MPIEKEIEIMSQYQLTAEEWMLTKLLLLAKEDFKEPITRFYQEAPHERSLYNSLEILQNKGIILKSYKVPKEGSPVNSKDIPFNLRFIHNYYKTSGELGEELFEKYPYQIIMDGKVFTANNLAKHYHSETEFYYAYGKAINFDPEKHKEVMDILDRSIESNIIKFGICEFVISKKWITLKKILDSGDIYGYSNSELI